VTNVTILTHGCQYRTVMKLSTWIGANMLANLLKHMKVVEFGDAELKQPISVTNRGTVATVKDLIAESAPEEVRAMFGTAATTAGGHVRPVSKLDPQSLRRVALAVLQQSNPAERVAVIGLGDYTTNELVEEVNHGTVMGARIVDAVRLNGLFMERAIASGAIRPREHHYQRLHTPDFDF
jgi:hypothetical protein